MNENLIFIYAKVVLENPRVPRKTLYTKRVRIRRNQNAYSLNESEMRATEASLDQLLYFTIVYFETSNRMSEGDLEELD